LGGTEKTEKGKKPKKERPVPLLKRRASEQKEKTKTSEDKKKWAAQ